MKNRLFVPSIVMSLLWITFFCLQFLSNPTPGFLEIFPIIFFPLLWFIMVSYYCDKRQTLIEMMLREFKRIIELLDLIKEKQTNKLKRKKK